MPTLGYLVNERAELQLRFLLPAHARIYAHARVTEIAEMPLIQPASAPRTRLTPGTLALVGLTGGLDEPGSAALEQMVRYLGECGASGLVMQAFGPAPRVPLRVRARAERLQIPLLITTAGQQWGGVNERLQQQRARSAERHVERLDGLLSSLPSQFANTRSIERIVDWLAAALDAVVVLKSTDRGTLACSPNGSSEATLGTQSADGLHQRRVQIHGTADATVLEVSSRRPVDETSGRLIQHAAKVLGLCEQAQQEHCAAVLAPRAVSQAAAQLLLAGHVAMGQAVAGAISRNLMETDEVVVRVIDTGDQRREPTLALCERALHGRALVSPCPGKDQQIMVITPRRRDADVEPALRTIVGSRAWLLMGGSAPHELAASGAGHAEAAEAVRAAARSPERISVGAEQKLAALLPRREARAWAASLLAPLLTPTHATLLRSLPIGLAFQRTEAAKALRIHRNTLRRRLDRAASLLGLDLDRLNDRVVVLLALQVLALPAPSAPSDAVDGGQHVALADLLTGLDVAEWARQRLRALLSDYPGVLATVRVWLEKDLSVRDTAQALDLSLSTVRARTVRAARLLGMEASIDVTRVGDTDVIGIADVYVAVHLFSGTPLLTDARPADARRA
ncbi:helix-turn-helix domain-containing protein [Streptomyces sp. NPDC046985]|uniref:helix-turn-helix domain-containing protein n=1 Tax=Streptomyces sp. NPDC046985 TaxID=3155377 RepID=UPI0033F8F322